MGHFSCEIRDSRSLSSLNASLKEREVICQFPPYSFRFPQEQYTTGSDMNNPSNLWTKSYKVDFLVTRPKKLEIISFYIPKQVKNSSHFWKVTYFVSIVRLEICGYVFVIPERFYRVSSEPWTSCIPAKNMRELPLESNKTRHANF